MSRVGNNPQKQNKSNQNGFTIFELLIVMTILAISIGAVFTFYKSDKGSIALKTLVHKIAAKIRKSRTSAINHQSEKIVLVDVNQKRIHFQDSNERIQLQKKLKLSITSAESENLSKSKTSIRFFPNGSSTGGVIKIFQKAQAYEIRVNWLTGRVTSSVVPNE